MDKNKAIAHENQSLEDHLLGTAKLCRIYASKLGLDDVGELLGLLHDTGKYGQLFQNYIKSGLGILNPDIDYDYVNVKENKGKIDHSTAGAQLLLQKIENLSYKKKKVVSVISQLLSLCLVSHHSGLIDNLSCRENGIENIYDKRIHKDSELTYVDEVKDRIDYTVANRINDLVTSGTVEKLRLFLLNISKKENNNEDITCFYMGMLVRFLFSCLIDADRQDTSNNENGFLAYYRLNGKYVPWKLLIRRLESHLKKFDSSTPINKIRQRVSDDAKKASYRQQKVFTMTAPTGSGKHLASLRFALRHAHRHKLDRILYVLPYTTIIDQNADEARTILSNPVRPKDRIVIEHHHNVENEKNSWKEKLLTENWDAPITYTTMVQFLNSIYSSRTRNTRRMHNLVNSVIIFDEIQSLPIKCMHLFINAINFLVEHCGSTVVLCTATQPTLHALNKQYGHIKLKNSYEIISDVQSLFTDLKRVKVIDKTKTAGWSTDDIVQLIIKQRAKNKSCLTVVNTKKVASTIFKELKFYSKNDKNIFHLSTDMCPAHRKNVLKSIIKLLQEGKPVICISTQVVEAGVDIDFNVVIRSIAGLSSIAQAAGRCNRHGKQKEGKVYIINPVDENITGSMIDIRKGIEQTQRILYEFKEKPVYFGNNLIGLEANDLFFNYYFKNRENEMCYKVKHKNTKYSDINELNVNLFDLFGTNGRMVEEYKRMHKKEPAMYFKQAFMTGANVFNVIEDATSPILIPYGKEGKRLLSALKRAQDPKEQRKLISAFQKYSVRIYNNRKTKLLDHKAIKLLRKDMDYYYVTPEYYDEDCGLIYDVEDWEYV